MMAMSLQLWRWGFALEEAVAEAAGTTNRRGGYQLLSRMAPPRFKWASLSPKRTYPNDAPTSKAGLTRKAAAAQAVAHLLLRIAKYKFRSGEADKKALKAARRDILEIAGFETKSLFGKALFPEYEDSNEIDNEQLERKMLQIKALRCAINPWRQTECEAPALLSKASEAAAKHEAKKAKKAEKQEFKEWVEENLGKGAPVLHKVAKHHILQHPAAVHKLAPQKVADSQAEEWAERWKAKTDKHIANQGEEQESAIVRKAIQGFIERAKERSKKRRSRRSTSQLSGSWRQAFQKERA